MTYPCKHGVTEYCGICEVVDPPIKTMNDYICIHHNDAERAIVAHRQHCPVCLHAEIDGMAHRHIKIATDSLDRRLKLEQERDRLDSRCGDKQGDIDRLSQMVIDAEIRVSDAIYTKNKADEQIALMAQRGGELGSEIDGLRDRVQRLTSAINLSLARTINGDSRVRVIEPLQEVLENP